MIGFKALIAGAIMSMSVVTSASAQCPTWAKDNPPLFQSQYPNRDVLNDCELTPAGRMGLELPGGAAPVFGASKPYEAMASSGYAQRPRSRIIRHHVR
jgi:hypothetical protein